MGAIDHLVSDDPRADSLRDAFVIKVIPIINPDGVYRGHFRSDQWGVNLNRMYLDPTLEAHPTVYGIRKIVEYFKDKIYFYIDCHSHSNKRSTFIFGNCMDYYKCIDNYMFAKLM